MSLFLWVDEDVFEVLTTLNREAVILVSFLGRTGPGTPNTHRTILIKQWYCAMKTFV